jgi:hypothetical protein
MAKRQRWSNDELLVALELYLRFKPSQLSKQDPEILDLARLTARSHNAVYMKLCNFLSLDPKYPGDGLTHIGRADREIWSQFATKPAVLGAAAMAARKSLTRRRP